MRSLLLFGTLLFILPLTALAFQTETFGWEGSDIVLGIKGDGVASLETVAPIYTGAHSLKFEETPYDSDGGTPQAYVAWIQDLDEGDTVAASFWVYDDTPSASPSGRIWGHYNDDPSDPMVENGSPGLGSGYSGATTWTLLEYEWTIAAGHTGWVIEARLYASAEFDAIWVDDLTIIAPDGATILFPGDITSLERNTWGAIKTAF